jgi:hypothetical protein
MISTLFEIVNSWVESRIRRLRRSMARHAAQRLPSVYERRMSFALSETMNASIVRGLIGLYAPPNRRRP